MTSDSNSAESSLSQQPSDGHNTSAPPADFRVLFRTHLMDAASALGKKEFKYALAKADALLAVVDDPRLGDKERSAVPAIRGIRLGAHYGLSLFEQVARELSDPFWQEAQSHVQWEAFLVVGLVSFERIGDIKQADAFCKQLVGRILTETKRRVHVARTAVAAVDDLSKFELYGRAAQLLTGVIEAISESDSHMREVLAFAYQRAIATLRKVGHLDDSLQLYHKMTANLGNDLEEGVKSELAWGGTEAARSLRALDRHRDADNLVETLHGQFGESRQIRTRKAIAWALAERSKTCVSEGDFGAAVAVCTQFIEHLEATGRAPELEGALAWAYAQRAYCLHKAKRYDEAIISCDEAVSRFDSSNDVDVLSELAYMMGEKVLVLRHSNRLTKSIAAARALRLRFADANDDRIVRERCWAIHAEGEALLCEGKLFRKDEMHEDGALKLEEAWQCFNEAVEKSPREPKHLGCRSYVEFLLGRIEDSKATLFEAMKDRSSWMDDADWNDDLRMFEVPENSAYVAAASQWRLQVETDRQDS